MMPASARETCASALRIFEILIADDFRRPKAVLATIVGLVGSGARAVGTHMAVLENGQSFGSFSSGCVESAVIAEALEVLRGGKARLTRYGQGSPYIDIRLPCGGGMDILFIPDPSEDALRRAYEGLKSRKAVSLHLGRGGELVMHTVAGTGMAAPKGAFVVHHRPPLRIIAAGSGAETIALLNLGLAYGVDIEILSPETEIVEAARERGIVASRLRSVHSRVSFRPDPWTAVLFLFHDHDWEPPLMAQALETSCFWIGAMGSKRSQQVRRDALIGLGLSKEDAFRVKGPIGLIPSSRDPMTLALSALGEIVDAYEKHHALAADTSLPAIFGEQITRGITATNSPEYAIGE